MVFPTSSEYGGALFEEAIRYLEDGAALLDSQRYAGSVTASVKAVELAMKALATSRGALGWWPALFRDHRPVTQAQSHHLMRTLLDELNRQSPGVVAEAATVETLNPTAFGAGDYRTDRLRNVEYPWYNADPDLGEVGMVLPSRFFTAFEARTEYNRALRFAGAVRAIEPSLPPAPLPNPR